MENTIFKKWNKGMVEIPVTELEHARTGNDSYNVYFQLGYEKGGTTYWYKRTTNPITIHVSVTQAQEYTISYNPGEGAIAPDGTSYEDDYVKKDSTITLKPAPIREGYKFIGWKVEGSEILYQPGQEITPTGDMTLVAQWDMLNPYQYQVVLETETTDVSAGDEITYTVKLKNLTDKESTLGSFRITPPVNSKLLELIDGNATANHVKYDKVADNPNPEFTYASVSENDTITVAANGEVVLGTLTYRVKAHTINGVQVTVVSGSEDDQVSNPGYPDAVSPTVQDETGVTYHVIKVTFEQDKDKITDFYVPYGGSDLYENLDKLAGRKEADKKSAPELSMDSTGGTVYRLKDANWHLEGNPDTLYDAATTKLTADTTYVTNRVDLVKVTPSDKDVVEVPTTDKQVVTERDGGTYVDRENDLTFKVDPNPTPGKKYDVTVTVNGKTVTPEQDADGNYKVKGDDVTGEVKITVESVLDLSADDIRIFTTNEDSDAKAYLQYSAYSGNDTLVLIQGKAGANYTLDAGKPVIYATDAYKDIDEGKTYTHAVLVPKPKGEVSAKAMLEYLKETCGLATTTEKNTEIKITWDTNGNGNVKRDLGDVQAANDFKTLTDLKWTPSDDLLLLADVMTIPTDATATADKYAKEDYTAKRDGQVNDADVNAFVYFYAKLG